MKTLMFIVLLGVAGLLCAGERECFPVALCLRAADAARLASTNKNDQFHFLAGFRYGYVEALIGERYSSSLDQDQSPYARGFRVARQDVRQRTEKNQPVGVWLGDFGYTSVTSTGIVALGFEKAHFTPRGETNSWWLRLPAEVQERLGQRYFQLWRDKKSLSIKGLLSPEGRYGHFGMCKREVIVYELKDGVPPISWTAFEQS